MTLTLALLAFTLVISFGLLLVNLQLAPEGHEDENGFHAKAGTGGNLFSLVARSQPKAIPIYSENTIHPGLV